jgi:hypothetical protein
LLTIRLLCPFLLIYGPEELNGYEGSSFHTHVGGSETVGRRILVLWREIVVFFAISADAMIRHVHFMAIDNPKEAFDKQYMQDNERSPLGLSVFAGKLAFPKAGVALEILRKVAERFTRPSVEERLHGTWNMLVTETDYLEATKASHEDVAEAIQIALRRDAEQFNDEKRERYVKIIGNALRSETQINDIASFIRTIEQLNDRDVTVLKVLNQVMNKEGDWKATLYSVSSSIKKLHPSEIIARSQELAVQVAMALGQRIETNNYSREEGYAICNRLQGFGLAHEIDAQQRELPLTNYCFRLSTQGVRLLKLMGENVPNYECYSEF